MSYLTPEDHALIERLAAARVKVAEYDRNRARTPKRMSQIYLTGLDARTIREYQASENS